MFHHKYWNTIWKTASGKKKMLRWASDKQAGDEKKLQIPAENTVLMLVVLAAAIAPT